MIQTFEGNCHLYFDTSFSPQTINCPCLTRFNKNGAMQKYIFVINPINCCVASRFSEDYSIAACMAMLLSNYHLVIFCNFSDSVIFHKSVSNVDNLLWRKIRYQNAGETNPAKVCVTHVIIIITRLQIDRLEISEINNQIRKLNINILGIN